MKAKSKAGTCGQNQYIRKGQRVLQSDIFRNVARDRKNFMHLDLSSHKFSEVLWFSVGHWFSHMLVQHTRR